MEEFKRPSTLPFTDGMGIMEYTITKLVKKFHELKEEFVAKYPEVFNDYDVFISIGPFSQIVQWKIERFIKYREEHGLECDKEQEMIDTLVGEYKRDLVNKGTSIMVTDTLYMVDEDSNKMTPYFSEIIMTLEKLYDLVVIRYQALQEIGNWDEFLSSLYLVMRHEFGHVVTHYTENNGCDADDYDKREKVYQDQIKIVDESTHDPDEYAKLYHSIVQHEKIADELVGLTPEDHIKINRTLFV